MMLSAGAKNAVKDKRTAFRSRSSSELAKILDGVRRGGYFSRMCYRQRPSVNVRARLITGEKTREAGRTIIVIMFPAHEA
jgi:hypothetical protein